MGSMPTWLPTCPVARVGGWGYTATLLCPAQVPYSGVQQLGQQGRWTPSVRQHRRAVSSHTRGTISPAWSSTVLPAGVEHVGALGPCSPALGPAQAHRSSPWSFTECLGFPGTGAPVAPLSKHQAPAARGSQESAGSEGAASRAWPPHSSARPLLSPSHRPREGSRGQGPRVPNCRHSWLFLQLAETSRVPAPLAQPLTFMRSRWCCSTLQVVCQVSW